jgi:hypothetical protein
MRWLGKISLLVLTSGLALAQDAQKATLDDTKPVTDELQALRDTMARQKQQMAEQGRELGALQKAMETKKAGVPHAEDVALHTNPPVNANTEMQGTEKPKESPLSFRIGGTEFTPGGFVDFENVFRTTNTGNNVTTAFQAIPFSNTIPIANAIPGHLTEFRTTGQYSRFNMKITGKFGANDILGYVETDFNGNDATNVFTTSNPHTMRLRLYWVDVKRGKWEFLGGQAYGLMTPNRVGLSPMPPDLLITYNEDSNIQVGTNWTRAGQFRLVWHPSDSFQWGFGIENPEQFAIGVAFPAAFATSLNGQFNPQNASNGTPNVAPDLVTKMAWDGNPEGRHMHFELGAIMTSARATFLPIAPGTPVTFQHTTDLGGGLQSAIVVSMTKNFRMVGNALWGKGVGRYMIGTGPQAVVAPVQVGPASFNATLSGIHAGNALFGFEWQASPKSLFAAYYGAAYFWRNAFPDLTSTELVKPIIGYGGIGSPNTNNRAIQEPTVNWDQTFWRNPQYGAVVLVTQVSYLTRSPWFVAPGAPKNAHLTMVFASLRYMLP